MRKLLLLTICIALCSVASEPHIFTNKDGNTLEDTIIKYDLEKEEVLLESSGRLPLNIFSEEDQRYILQWNQINGFLSTMRCKLSLDRDRWARMKQEQNRTPVYIEADRRPHFGSIIHQTTPLEEYEEYSSIELDAVGFSLKVRNQNFFPLENIIVQSKVLYEETLFQTSDSFYESESDLFDEVITKQRVRFREEPISVLIPLEEITVHSATAIITEQKLDRTIITTSEEEEDDDGSSSIDDFGDWSDHNRDREDNFIGVWFRIGIQDHDGQLTWRHVSYPDDLFEELIWDEL
jgi:hypothetical protein